MMDIELPEPLPCPCCGNTHLYVGTMSADSQGVHCVHIDDDVVSRLLMMNRNNKKKQQEIIDSPQFKGCGMCISRSLPTDYPEDLQDLPYKEAHPELERRVLAEAIHAWNERC